MASKYLVKRSSVSGNAPNTTNIDTGELAINLPDGILYSSNGTNIFEIGANVSSLDVNGVADISDSLTVGNSTVNTFINSTSMSIDGNSVHAVFGNSDFDDHYIQIRDDTSLGIMIGHRANNTHQGLHLRAGTGKAFAVHANSTVAFGSLTLNQADFYINSAGYAFFSNTVSITGNLDVTDHFSANTKSFLIDHPTPEKMRQGYKLKYGVLEGPEHAVYVRGRTSDPSFDLPDYWADLCDMDTLTVQLTPIGTDKPIGVGSINGLNITVAADEYMEYFYYAQATRKDVEPLVVEYIS